ncbi:hypothetical protein Ddye_002859 [Dipteronia dyeriana]|uniref:Uncharacterized protein n=1 Tax=Dipteronia dyeriana TaxID=168575 RepID=A0AAE0CUS0_9ROSI|nr:hypothetical protein Ddye_002859 [Dipteronia dyeriana]
MLMNMICYVDEFGSMMEEYELCLGIWVDESSICCCVWELAVREKKRRDGESGFVVIFGLVDNCGLGLMVVVEVDDLSFVLQEPEFVWWNIFSRFVNIWKFPDLFNLL